MQTRQTVAKVIYILCIKVAGKRSLVKKNKEIVIKEKYLAVHSVELVVEGHGEVVGGAGGHVCDKGRLALVDRVVHVDAALADLHVLEARLHAAQGARQETREVGRGGWMSTSC